MAVFDLAAHVVASSAGVITGGMPPPGGALLNAQNQLEAMTLGELLPIFLQVQIVSLLMNIVGILIPIVIWGRMIEIYLTVSVAPIPLATLVNRERLLYKGVQTTSPNKITANGSFATVCSSLAEGGK